MKYHLEIWDEHRVQRHSSYTFSSLELAIITLQGCFSGTIMFDYDKNGNKYPIVKAWINNIEIPITTNNVTELGKEIKELIGFDFIEQGEMIL